MNKYNVLFLLLHAWDTLETKIVLTLGLWTKFCKICILSPWEVGPYKYGLHEKIKLILICPTENFLDNSKDKATWLTCLVWSHSFSRRTHCQKTQWFYRCVVRDIVSETDKLGTCWDSQRPTTRNTEKSYCKLYKFKKKIHKSLNT